MLLGSHSLALYRKRRSCDVPAFVLLLLFITVHTKTLVWMEFLVVQRFWLLWCYKLKKNKLFVVFFFKKVPSMYCTVTTTRCWDNVKQWHVFLSYSWIIYDTNIYNVHVPWCFFFFVKVQVTEKSCLIINIYFLTISTLLLLFLAQGEMKIYKLCATF